MSDIRDERVPVENDAEVEKRSTIFGVTVLGIAVTSAAFLVLPGSPLWTLVVALVFFTAAQAVISYKFREFRDGPPSRR